MVRITVRNGLSPKLRELISRLGPAGRQTVNQGVGASVYALVRTHFGSYAARHHGTAHRLGAAPTGHLEDAAAASVWGASAQGAWVELRAAGISRATRALTITPRKRRWLTIPVHRDAYGKTVAEVKRTIPLHRRGRALVGQPSGAPEPVPLYALVRRVVIPRDPTMLPGQDAMRAAAASGAKQVIASVLKRAQ